MASDNLIQPHTDGWTCFAMPCYGTSPGFLTTSNQVHRTYQKRGSTRPNNSYTSTKHGWGVEWLYRDCSSEDHMLSDILHI